MSEQFHRQCLLKREGREQIGFIPEQFARAGRVLRLRVDEVWEDGWRVDEVWSRMASSEISVRSQDYKHQRKASDI